MTTLDFRALCADLLNNLEHSAFQHCSQGEIDNDPLITRARAALAQPEPETLAEALAARPLLEKVARLGDCIGQQTVGQVRQLAGQAAAWLRGNPPGQPVAIEPRGCPAPGACSCVEPTPPAPAPEPGEVAQLVRRLRDWHSIPLLRERERAATLLQRLSAPAPAVVPVAVSERPWEKGGWTDLDGECWWCPPDGPAYWSMANPAMVYGG